MSPRERILELAREMQAAAEMHTEMGIRLLHRGTDDMEYAQKLAFAAARLSDEDCAEIVATWGPEKERS